MGDIKTLFCGKSGDIDIEDIDDQHVFVELPDGYHHVPTDGVYRPRDPENPPLVPMFDGMVNPVNCSHKHEDMESLLNLVSLGKVTGQEVATQSSLERYSKQFFQYLPFIIVLTVLAYSFLTGA